MFPRRKIAVFVDGCFWHGCPEHGRRSWKFNVEYWPQKIATNRARDADTTLRLESAGWLVLRYWEHQDPKEVAEDIRRQVTGSD